LLIIWIFSRKDTFVKAELKESLKSLKKIGETREAAALNIKEILKGLPIAPQRIDMPEESLLVDINNLRELVYNLAGALEKRNMADRRIKEKEDAVMAIMNTCGMGIHTDILENIVLLEKSLSEAERHFKDSRDGYIELKESNNRLYELEAKLREVKEEMQIILNGLSEIEGETIKSKMDKIEELRSYRSKALTLKEELEKEHPDILNIIIEIKSTMEKGGGWVFDTEKVAKAKAEREQLDSELNKLNEEMGSLKKDLERRQEQERLDDINGQIEIIKDERKSIAIKRDKLLLLKKVLIEADRIFRDENQPDVLQKAGHYLEIITGGRYNRIFAKDDGEGLLVKKDSYEYPLEVMQPLSRGTLEQIYMALRLALLDHLDEGKESIPIFLDEAMVNWDSIRLERGIELLESISKNRQVFLFTCHEWLVEMLKSSGDAEVIELI